MTDLPACPTCNSPARYVADIGAPGYGQAWECEKDHPLIMLGGSLIDPAEYDADDDPPWILTEGDVR